MQCLAVWPGVGVAICSEPVELLNGVMWPRRFAVSQ